MLGTNFIMMMRSFGCIRDYPIKGFSNKTYPNSKGKTPYLHRYACAAHKIFFFKPTFQLVYVSLYLFCSAITRICNYLVFADETTER